MTGNVTYRSLISRELGVHVDTAKKYPAPLFQSLFPRSNKLHGVYSELAAYHASSASSCATYLITGEVPTARKSFGDEMDVDGDEDEVYMPEMRIVLVGDDNLECEFSARVASFHRI